MAINNCGVYVHIPFCLSKCAYCDFLSVPYENGADSGADGDILKRYTDALINEIGACSLLDGRTVDTVYIGGGTPTVLPTEYLAGVLRSISERFDIAPGAEITVEANPGTVDAGKLSALRGFGANRLSIGLQAWQDKHLRALGRIHTKDQFVEAYGAARAAGFDNINADIMFALPGQSHAEWAETLENAVALAPEHISAYALAIEPGTPMGRALEAGRVIPAGEESDRRMYHFARDFLADNGYRQYELSNFAKCGRESRHNVNCWRRAEYIGFGAGAHSFFRRSPSDHRRFSNTADIGAYIENGGVCPGESVRLEKADEMSEFMFLGLRLTDGVGEADFLDSFGIGMGEVYGRQLAALVAGGLINRGGGNVRLTPLGMDLANRVFVEFL